MSRMEKEIVSYLECGEPTDKQTYMRKKMLKYCKFNQILLIGLHNNMLSVV